MNGRSKAEPVEGVEKEFQDVETEQVVKATDNKLQTARERQRVIGRELRKMYNEVVNEPVPDDFYDLLRELDNVDPTKGKE